MFSPLGPFALELLWSNHNEMPRLAGPGGSTVTKEGLGAEDLEARVLPTLEIPPKSAERNNQLTAWAHGCYALADEPGQSP